MPLTPQRLKVVGTVLNDALNGHDSAGDDTGGTRQLHKERVSNLQCSMNDSELHAAEFQTM